MRRPHLLIIVSLFSIEAFFVSCRKTTKQTTTIPAVHTSVSIHASFPAQLGKDLTCSQPKSWIVRLATAETPSWTYTFLFDSSLTVVYGCSGGGPCVAGTDLNREIDHVQRVAIEGLSVPPLDAEVDASSVDVLCRGIADAGVLPSSIVDDTSGQDAHSFAVEVAVLRVGASNPLPFISSGIVPPPARYGAAASLSDVDAGVGVDSAGPGGAIAIAGGVVNEGSASVQFPVDIYRFSPRTLAFTKPALLSTNGYGVAGLSATVFNNSGIPTVLFAGGATSSTISGYQATRSATLFRDDGSVAHRLLAQPRAFQSAHFLRRAGREVVGLFGGVPYDPSANAFARASARNDFEYFVPSGSTAGGGCSGVSDAFCSPSSAHMTFARGEHASVYYESNGEPRVWLAYGSASVGSAEVFNGISDGSFALDGQLFGGLTLYGPASALARNTGYAPLDGLPVSAGGENSANGSNVGLVRGYYGSLPILKIARASATATALRDGTILVAGGYGAIGVPVEPILERFVPNPPDAVNYPGRFEYIPSGLSGGMCTASVAAPDCQTLLGPRFGHSATRIEGSRTWLDGAVLFVGGIDPASAFPNAEIYVPAYACDASTRSLPVNPVTGAAAADIFGTNLPSFCDRGRRGESITNPQTGAAAN